MNTDQLPFIERNFHIMNEDRFIMEKISLPVEMQDGEDIHAAINRTRESIVQNFNAAYPHVYPYLNFHVVKQVNGNDNNIKKVLHTFTVPPEPPNHSNKELIAMQEQSEKINKGTIEEQIDSSFNLIGEINKCKSHALLHTYSFMCQTDEEHAAYNKRKKELQKQSV